MPDVELKDGWLPDHKVKDPVEVVMKLRERDSVELWAYLHELTNEISRLKKRIEILENRR